jgi:hypothetical protein
MKAYFIFVFVIFLFGCAATINNLNVLSVQTAESSGSDSVTTTKMQQKNDSEKTHRPLENIINKLKQK